MRLRSLRIRGGGTHHEERNGATGTVIRRPIMETYAQDSGFSGVEVLPVEHDVWRFYRLSWEPA